MKGGFQPSHNQSWDKMKKMTCVKMNIQFAMIILMSMVVTSSYAWTECYDGTCYECPVDFENGYVIMYLRNRLCAMKSGWDQIGSISVS